ncbi:MAG: hydrogenase formation protein HypD [Pseudomonadota bacterium]
MSQPQVDDAAVGRFREAGRVERLVGDIARLDPPRPMRFMHVCGTHENAICQFGLRDLLPPWLRLVAGPGCPVCVCPAAEIDMAVRVASSSGAIVTTFGDVVRVPARISLSDCKAQGGDCRVVYGIADAVEIARREPNREVVFFAVGFETTACTVAAALLDGVPANFSILSSHRLVPPALAALCSQTAAGELDGFLLPGHVTTIIGLEPYEKLVEESRLPMVVAGFEPVDVLLAIRRLAKLTIEEHPALENAYGRCVRASGNLAARKALAEVFEPSNANWRGIGAIASSGMRLRESYASHDAARRLGIEPDGSIADIHPGCRCGEVLLGRVEPEECPLFGRKCIPEAPIGPCMVAFEGTCHARMRHAGRRFESIRVDSIRVEE